MDSYTTLVFRSDSESSREFVRDLSSNELCIEWSMDNELLRPELIEQALDVNDMHKAKIYLREVSVSKFLDDLDNG